MSSTKTGVLNLSSKSETEKLKTLIDGLPIAKYHKVPQILCKFEDRSKSGLTRWYNFYAIQDNDLIRLTWSFSEVYKENGLSNMYDKRREAFKIGGYGFDGAFDTVYTISKLLFDDGYYLDYRSF